MPNHKTHLVAGLVCGLVLTAMFKHFYPQSMNQIYNSFLYTSFALAGSLFPDIDIKSKIQLMFWPVATVFILIALATSQINLFMIISFFVFFIVLVGHRTITHQFWFVTLFPFLLALYVIKIKAPKNIIFFCVIYFIVGAYSHIVLDRTMTYFKKKRRRR